jgi:uncharacterized protein (DUF1697 family)
MTTRLVAFLRAVNVGGHVVKMEALRRLFELFGLEGVETFIASGNVLFNDPGTELDALTAAIEQGLQAALGYRVAACLRTPAEMSAIAGFQPFDPAVMEAAEACNVGFLAHAPDEAARQKLLVLQTDLDRLRLHGRELYWLCQVRQSQSKLSNAAFEKALGMPCTLRGINTVRKIEGLLGL